MVIKNVNYTSAAGSFSGRKLDKTDCSKVKQNTDSAFAGKLNKASNPAKVDTIELSPRPVAGPSSLSKARDKILAEINEDKDAQYIEKLKAQLNTNQYGLDAQELAKSLLLNNDQ